MTTREINALLALRGLTLVQIAKDVGESQKSVSHIVNYERATQRVREKVARRLGIPVDELFDLSVECMPAKLRKRLAAAKPAAA